MFVGEPEVTEFEDRRGRRIEAAGWIRADVASPRRDDVIDLPGIEGRWRVLSVMRIGRGPYARLALHVEPVR